MNEVKSIRFNGSVIEIVIDNSNLTSISLESESKEVSLLLSSFVNNNQTHYMIELDDCMPNEVPVPVGRYSLIGEAFTGERLKIVYSKKVNYHHVMNWFSKGKRFDFDLNISNNDLGEMRIEIGFIGQQSTVAVDPQLNQKKEHKRVRQFKKAVFRLSYKLFTLFPVRKKQISFLSDSRTEMTGNFEYIQNEILSRDVNFNIKTSLQKSNQQKRSLRRYISIAWLIATSRYVILDDFYPLVYPLKIRKNVDLIQVWHAVGAFKTFGFSRVGKPGGPNPASKNHRNYTHAIVSSKFVAPFYAEGFGIDLSKVNPLGVARTDLFFDDELKSSLIESTKNDLPFLKDKRVILFAPTFRGNGQTTAHYKFDKINFHDLYANLNDGNTVFLLKIHPFVLNKPSIPKEYSDFFYDVSNYREINNLLLLADVLVTDYSSVVFEFALLRKKMVFFAPDLDDYIAARDFYVDYKEFVPGPISRTTDELINDIRDNAFDESVLNGFLSNYFDDLDGKSSKRLVDALENGFNNLK